MMFQFAPIVERDEHSPGVSGILYTYIEMYYKV